MTPASIRNDSDRLGTETIYAVSINKITVRYKWA